MRTTPCIVVICDHCQAYDTPITLVHFNNNGVQGWHEWMTDFQLQKRGWRIYKDGSLMCPNCRERIDDETKEQKRAKSKFVSVSPSTSRSPSNSRSTK